MAHPRARRFLLSALMAAAPLAAEAADSAVVFIYHRFGEDSYPSTSIRAEQFAAQVEELKTGGYTVLPLHEIAAKLKSGEGVPPRTVGLSVDDAYRSAYEIAWPLLRRGRILLRWGWTVRSLWAMPRRRTFRSTRWSLQIRRDGRMGSGCSTTTRTRRLGPSSARFWSGLLA